MNKKTMMLAATLALGITGTTAYAEKGSSNGQPFKALQAQIDANRALIGANGSAISSLQGQVISINGRIDALDASLDDLATQVSLNTADIQAAFARIDSADAGIDALRADVTALEQHHADEMDLVNQAIADLTTQLDTLNQAREALAGELNAKLDALTADVTDNALAIDSLVLQLVTVNAQLTSINSSILDLQKRSEQLEDAQALYAAQLAELRAILEDLQNAVDTLQSYHLRTFSGIQTNVAVDSLNGWSECYKTSYADRNAQPENMMAACTGRKIMLACRPTGSDILSVAAHANREDVFFNTDNGGNTVHNANGVDWYFSDNYSMGFAPEGEGVLRNSADIKDYSSIHRLSWHTHNSFAGGWRCGSAIGLNSSTSWEKLIYQAD